MTKPKVNIEGLIKQVDDQPDVQTVGESDLSRVAAEEAFMHELVKIIVHSSADANAAPYVHLSVNGEGCTVFREVPSYVRRKHLEVLARMKETRISQNMNPDPQGEITTASLRGHTGLAYPFTVLEDKNPKGGAWLANVLAERG